MKRITIVENPTRNGIKEGDTLTARSIGDNDIIFKVHVLSRKGNFVTIKDDFGHIRRTKVRVYEGEEYLKPDNYSFAPIYKSKNPYVSEAQERFFHAAEKRGQIPHATVEEYDRESEGLELPERANGKFIYNYKGFTISFRGTGLFRIVDKNGTLRATAKTLDLAKEWVDENGKLPYFGYTESKKNPNEAYIPERANAKYKTPRKQKVAAIDNEYRYRVTWKTFNNTLHKGFHSLSMAKSFFEHKKRQSNLVDVTFHTNRENPSNEAYLLTIGSKSGEGRLQAVYVLDASNNKELGKFKSVISAENFARRKGLKLLKNPVKPGLDYRQRSTHYVVTAKGRVVKHGTNFDKLLEYAEKHNENYDSKYYVITTLDYMHKKFTNEK